MRVMTTRMPITKDVARIVAMPPKARYQKKAIKGCLITAPNEDKNREKNVMDT